MFGIINWIHRYLLFIISISKLQCSFTWPKQNLNFFPLIFYPFYVNFLNIHDFRSASFQIWWPTEITLIYVRGSIIRRILNHTNCNTCTDVMIERIKEASDLSFLLQMDFSGTSLLQPTEEMMIFFRILLSVYLFHKPSLANNSLSMNVLQILQQSSWKLLARQQYKVPFCDAHNEKFTNLMILSSQKLSWNHLSLV